MRTPIAQLIRGDRAHHTVAGWLADLWPVIATAFFVAIDPQPTSRLLGSGDRDR